MKSIVRCSVGCWLVICLGFGSVAFADDPLAKPKDTAARDHLAAGNKHYHVHELEPAIEEYKAGALKENAPVFLYNLGQCYRALGNYKEAIWHYEQFLAVVDPKGDVAVAVAGFVKNMKAELEKRAMSQPPSGPASEGAKPDSTAATMSTSTNAPPTTAGTPVVSLRATDEPEPAWYNDWLGWSAAGVGVAGVALGTYFLVDARNIGNSANAEPTESIRDSLRSKADSRHTLGALVTAGGAAFVVLGAIKLAITPQRSSTVTSWNVSLTPQGIQVFGGF